MELYVVLLCCIEGCQFACWELGAAFCHWDGRDWKWVDAGQPVSLLRCSPGAYPSLSPVVVSAALALLACHMPVSVPKGCLPVHTAITHLFPRTPHTCTQSLQVAYDFFFFKEPSPKPILKCQVFQFWEEKKKEKERKLKKSMSHNKAGKQIWRYCWWVTLRPC